MKTLKPLALTAVIALLWTPGARSQGTIEFNNLANQDASPGAANGGLVFLAPGLYLPPPVSKPVLADQDMNFQLLGGPNAQMLQPIHTWLLSDNSAKGIIVGPGHFADPSGGVYAIPGVQAGTPAMLQILAWQGSYDSLAAAARALAPYGWSGPFWNPTGGGGASASSLVDMPALIVYVPEPSSLTLALVGAVACQLSRRRFESRAIGPRCRCCDSSPPRRRRTAPVAREPQDQTPVARRSNTVLKVPNHLR